MLVLSRRVGESIVISVGGARVTVKVQKILGDQARLCFDAPREVQIDRLELDQAKERRRKAAELAWS